MRVVAGSRLFAISVPPVGACCSEHRKVSPEVVSIYVGSLDKPNTFKPQHVIFTRDRPDWLKMVPNIPEYQTVPA